MKLKDILENKFTKAQMSGIILFFVPSYCDYWYDVKDGEVVDFLLSKFGNDDVRVSGHGIFGEEAR